MSKWWKWIAMGTTAVVLVLGLALTAELGHFRYSLPDYDGTVQVRGLSAPVQILRDAHAVPHIIASSRADALFGLGYAAAQDRLWQMEFTTRVMQGRLAEMVGPAGVPTDVFMRTMGFYRLAEQSVAHLTPQTRKLLVAYAAGVNAYLKTRKGPLPIEFALMGATPEPWRPADSVAILKYMQLSLSGNMMGEIARAKLAGRLNRRQIEDLFPPYPGDPDNPLPAYLSLFAHAKAAALPVPDITASNNWVVSGARSVTGAPLLANDPHLGLTIPSIWYLAHLSFPGEDEVGAVLPGGPGITLGRNRTIAWGMTNTGPDTQDLYLEKLVPGDDNAYFTPTGTERFQTRTETISVRFGKPVTFTIRSTRHGPVLPPNYARTKGLLPKGYVLALAWTALTPNDDTMQAVMDIATAKNRADIDALMKNYLSPMQNMVYADTQGQIGLLLASRVPLRDPANDSLGLVPAKGWDARHDWKGYIPYNQLPRIDDPPSGQIATANNKTVPPGYPYTLTREWAEPFRFWQINKLLAETPRHSVATFRAIQLDIHDRFAEDLLPLLLKAGPWPTEEERRAVAMLSKWDYAMDANRPEPLIYEAWDRALVKRLIADELGPDFKPFWNHEAIFTLRVLHNVDGEGRWCDDVTTPAHEDCLSRIRLALGDALAELNATYGNDIGRWRWGDAHRAVFVNQPFSNFPILDRIFDREVEVSGGAFTIRRADFRFSSKRPYAADHGSGYRAIYDIAHPDNSLYVITTGESGNIFSPYYDDQLPLWAHGGYLRIPTSAKEIEATAKHRLTLQPESASAP
ncbi:MAG: penicillin acylase family protein [Alphaproteobacteria bacterium]|nr:penicillin acylase family protein [Alphaproteobacteria bacterium]